MLRIHMKQTITINKHENEGLKHCNDPKILLDIQVIWMAFIEILMNNAHKKRKV